MRKIFLFFLFLTNFIFAQKKAEVKPVSCPIATLQFDTVLVKLKDYNTQLKIVEAFQKQLQSEYDFKKLELETKIKEYGDKEKTMAEETKQQTVTALQKQQEELNTFLQESRQKFQQKQQELFQPLYDKIQKAIEKVAQKHGYSYITAKNNFFYASPAYDVTQLVIEEANQL